MSHQADLVPVHNEVKICETITQEDGPKYIMFPHAIIGGREIKGVVHNNKKYHTVLADSVKNTKLNSIKTIKTKTPLICNKNVILISNCSCSQKTRICTTKVNETGMIAAKRIITRKKSCDQFSHAYNKIKVKKGLFYSNQTRSLLKYLHWKHRNKLDLTHKYEFPTSNLIKLI